MLTALGTGAICQRRLPGGAQEIQDYSRSSGNPRKIYKQALLTVWPSMSRVLKGSVDYFLAALADSVATSATVGNVQVHAFLFEKTKAYLATISRSGRLLARSRQWNRTESLRFDSYVKPTEEARSRIGKRDGSSSSPSSNTDRHRRRSLKRETTR